MSGQFFLTKAQKQYEWSVFFLTKAQRQYEWSVFTN